MHTKARCGECTCEEEEKRRKGDEASSDEIPEGSFSQLPLLPDSAALAFYGGTAAVKEKMRYPAGYGMRRQRE